ncbi:hypothetical protein A2125_00135 [Candidatus Woesebacteria bacterium GWB1_43_5]|uniref:Uncharacterized protein n=1 Tax=Candidatus Woesebacteria bacterium GWB1_43_5 TaxID=1802474 RepID=A0A1F7WT62_9BACT|nr:MAG: hypothetical protein A2125_00135 [Candidatus Woesebacteria bacterium GWB1_43_5]
MGDIEKPEDTLGKRSLSEEALDLVISVASGAMEDIPYTRQMIEEIVQERDLDRESAEIISILEEEGVIKPLDKKDG